MTGFRSDQPGNEVSAGAVDFVGRTTMSISANAVMWQFFREHPLDT